MPCYKPLEGWQSQEVASTGGRQVKFTAKEGYLDKRVTVACGRCIGCRLDHSRMWALRCYHEAMMHPKNSFVTLNYKDEEKVYLGMQKGVSKNPKSKHYNKERDYVLSTIVKEDLQKFLKDLRYQKGPFKYYACGEYGEFGPGHHPHFHILLFGVDFKYSGQLPYTQGGSTLYLSGELEELWPRGFHSIGECNVKTAGYTARYCTKKISGPDQTSHYTVVDRFTGRRYPVTPEKAYMSRNPGIGARWLQKYWKDTRKDHLKVNGKTYSIPRYYRSFLDEVDPRTAERNKRRRKIERNKREKDSTIDRLAQREMVKLTQALMLERSHENEI